MYWIMIEKKVMYIYYKDLHGLAKFESWNLQFDDPSFVIITIYLGCLIHVPEKTRRGEEILHFHNMAMP